MSEQSNNRFTVVLIGWAKYPEYSPEIKMLSERIQNDKDYLILSEPFEMEFVMKSPEEILQGRMGKLQAIKADLVNEFGTAIAEINDTIAKFQSLSYDKPPAGTPSTPSYPTGPSDGPAPAEDAFLAQPQPNDDDIPF